MDKPIKSFMPRYKNFWDEIRGLKPGDPDYDAAMARYQAAIARDVRERKLRGRMVLRILELMKPAKLMNVSRLNRLEKEQLLEVGKAARALAEAMHKAGITL